MGLSRFHIKEHVVPCQHIREYRNATKVPRAALKLAVKQYTPIDGFDTSSQPITIIATHGTGIAKEAYEPLWEELSHRLKGKIRGIWIADCSHHGASGVLNEYIQGDDPNWFDHSRDLLGMINHFSDSIQSPIIGIGHSMGCAQLINLSLFHPSLFHSLVLLEPTMLDGHPPGPNAAMMTSYRDDLWPSREEAESALRKNKFYRSWDPRALALYLRHGLRDTPTALYPDAPPGSVALTTSKHQEAWTYLRSNFSPVVATTPTEENTTEPNTVIMDWHERLLSPDLNPYQAAKVFERAEFALALQYLPYLRPQVLFVFGERSYLNAPEGQDHKCNITGTAVRGGSGGQASGAVQKAVILGAGHMMPVEKIAQTAEAVAPFIDGQIARFLREEEFWKTHNSGKSEPGMMTLSKKWLAEVRQDPNLKRPFLVRSNL